MMRSNTIYPPGASQDESRLRQHDAPASLGLGASEDAGTLKKPTTHSTPDHSTRPLSLSLSLSLSKCCGMGEW